MKKAFAISYADLTGDRLVQNRSTMVQVYIPADCRAGHRRHNPRFQAPEEAPPPIPLLDNAGRAPKALHIPQLRFGRIAPGLQKRLDDIQRRSQTRRKTSGQASGAAVSNRIVPSGGIEEFGRRFVGDKLKGGEGDGHAKCCWVRDIESGETFGFEYPARAVV
jgi:hypothetical protein